MARRWMTGCSTSKPRSSEAPHGREDDQNGLPDALLPCAAFGEPPLLARARHNADDVRDFARRWRARGIPVFVYTANNRVGALPDFDRKLRLTREQVPLMHRIGRRAARAWLGHCPAPFATTDILHDGSVLLCTHDWARKEILGNVRDQTIAAIWNGERMREIRAAVYRREYERLPACRDCSLWKDGWV